MPIRDDATNVFMGLPGDGARLELTHNHDVDEPYDHRHRLRPHRDHRRRPRRHARAASPSSGIEPEKPPYTVREGGSRLCFVRDPDGLQNRARIEGQHGGRTFEGGGGLMRRGIVATAGALGVAALVWAAVAIADEIDCSGGGKQCNGTPFDDSITGSQKTDGINAKAGNDETYAEKGNDAVEAGDGNDYVEGGKGDDKISGGDDGDAVHHRRPLRRPRRRHHRRGRRRRTTSTERRARTSFSAGPATTSSTASESATTTRRTG